MSRSLLLTCNARSATISLHDYNSATHDVLHRRDVALPVPAGETHASAMALARDETMVYLGWRGTNKQLLSFALDRDAANLRLVDTRIIADDLCYLHAGADGQSLYGAGGDSIAVVPLRRDGLPAAVQRHIRVGPMAHCVVTDRQGRVFATACRGDTLIRFPADATPAGGVQVTQPPGSGPRHLCLSPNGRHIYLVSQEGGEVVVFANGAASSELQRLKMVPEEVAPMGGDIVVTPDGRFVFATERTTSRVVGFAVEPATGLLRRLSWTKVPEYPRAVCLTDKGRALVVLGFRGHSAEIFEIGDTGSLTPRAGFATGERPSWVLSVDLP